MFYAIQVDVIDLSPNMTVFGLSDDLDLVPGAWILWVAHDPSPTPFREFPFGYSRFWG
jgi:hypothetical protein